MQMKNPKKIYIFILVTFLICSIFVNIVQAVTETPADPGSEGDPIVSKSYVDSNITAQTQQLQILQDKYNLLVKDMDLLKTQISAGGSKGYEIISLEVGQKLLPGIGTEVILISGKANSIKGQNGGLLDTNSAKQLLTVLPIMINHLLVSAGDDGRGIAVVSKSKLLVRGTYKLAEKTKDDPVVTPVPDKPEKPEKPEKNIGSGIINTASLNIREKADITSKILIKLTKGQSVTIISISGEWYKIKTPDGLYGWTMVKYILKK
jgi:hypothetical protein